MWNNLLKTFSNAYAKVQKWTQDYQFPENSSEFGIILNNFWSSIIKSPKNSGIQSHYKTFCSSVTITRVGHVAIHSHVKDLETVFSSTIWHTEIDCFWPLVNDSFIKIKFSQPDLTEPWTPYVTADKMLECKPVKFNADMLKAAVGEKLCQLTGHVGRFCREGMGLTEKFTRNSTLKSHRKLKIK